MTDVRISIALALGIALALLPHSAATYPFWPDVQPATYASVDGSYSWQVDPSQRNGAGEANYVLSDQSGRRLEVDLPFTLLEAATTEDGHLYGYAYTDGRVPTAEDSRLLVVKISPSGAVQILADEPQEDSRYLHTPPYPEVTELIFDPDNDRMLLRVVDDDIDRAKESWWDFKLSTGEPGERRRPHRALDDQAILRVLAARPLSGTELLLVHFLTSSDGATGARFALLDPAMNVHWALDWADDYSRGRNEAETAVLIAGFDRSGAIVDVIGEGRFVVWSAARGERVQMQWTAGKMLERSRHQAGDVQDREAPALPPARQLQHLGDIELAPGDAGAALDWGQLIDFDIDELGRFGILLCTDCERNQRLIRVDDQGRVDASISIDAGIEALQGGRLISVGGTRWLWTYTLDQRRAVAEWIDFDTGIREPIVHLDSPPIVASASMSDGGFVVLTQRHEQRTWTNTLRAFSADGQTRWVVNESYADPTKHFSAEDLVVTANGDVVVLENARKQLKRYDSNGEYMRCIRLSDAWGRQPNYPTALSAAADGGLIVHDFGGRSSVVRMGADQQIQAAYTPQHRNGQRFDLHGRLRQGPDERIWVNDGSALLALDGSGLVTHIIGPRAEPERLGQIDLIQVSRHGQIYAVDGRTGAVHVFAANGAPLRVCKPDPADYSGEIILPTVGLADNGEVYISRRDHPGDVLHYGANCERLGVRALKGLIHSNRWLPQPGSDQVWVIGRSAVYMADSNGRVQLDQQRSAANRWLNSVDQAATGADGSLIVTSETSPMFVDERYLKPVFARFGADGEAISVWPTPSSLVRYANLAYDGQRTAYLVASDREQRQREIWVGDRRGRALHRVTLNESPERVFLVDHEGAAELWVHLGDRRLQRYALEP